MTNQTLNRRALLMGLASASTVAAGGVAAGAATPDAAPENPELLRLGDELPAFESAYLTARAEMDAIVRSAMRVWPSAPDEILSLGIGDVERDICGAGIQRAGQKYSCRVRPPEHFREMQEGYRSAIAKPSRAKDVEKRRNRFRELLAVSERGEALSEDYFAEIERIKEASGYEPARDRTQAALVALKAHVKRIMDEPETGMAGVIVKAQALAAWGKVETFARVLNMEGKDWAADFAASVMRQAVGVT